MKHFFALFATLALAFAGCGDISSSAAPVRRPAPEAADEKANAEKPTRHILFFTMDGCGPCEKFKNGPLKLLRKAGWEKQLREVSLEQHPELVEKHKVAAFPTFVLLSKGGEELNRHVGYMDQWAVGRFFENHDEARWRKALVNVGGCSGTCISPDGLILTVKHCGIQPQITIKFDGGESYKAKRVYVSPEAEGPVLLKVMARPPPGGFPYLRVAKEPPAAGDKVYSMGYPVFKVGDKREPVYTFNEGTYVGDETTAFTRADATGILDWLFRARPRLQPRPRQHIAFHITDFRCYPGNSGGPLLNQRGEVIGVLSMSNFNDPEAPGRSLWVRHSEVVKAVAAAPAADVSPAAVPIVIVPAIVQVVTWAISKLAPPLLFWILGQFGVGLI